MKKIIGSFFITALSFIALAGCQGDNAPTYKVRSINEIFENMTLEDKACQMVQGACYNVTNKEMEDKCYGSILSTFGNSHYNQEQWLKYTKSLQELAMKSKAAIPYIYGNDGVHGASQCEGAVIFPHNINIGAANDAALTYEMGLAVADELKLTGTLWNFAPVVGVSKDPRWGRTYECYSSDYNIVKTISSSFAKGLLAGGVMPCAKHFLADGACEYGTGEKSDVVRIIDRGNCNLEEAEINQLLSVYKQLIDDGVMSIMLNHGSLNGVKMHENKKYIDILKNDFHFQGVVLSDWESIHNITGETFKDKVIKAVNSGIDMLMEPSLYQNCVEIIVEAVNNNTITLERVNDATMRILRMKDRVGLLSDPFLEKLTTKHSKVGDAETRKIALELAEKSLVLIKNDNDLLPIKQNSKICLIGPASDDTGALCGGWTLTWSGTTDKIYGKKFVQGATSIKKGFEAIASEYNYELLSEDRISEADVVIACVGEGPYAEWNGDVKTENFKLVNNLELIGNSKALDLAKASNKPVVACIVSGRNVPITEYVDDFDSIVMCYLPGSEGACVSNVLSGKKPFTGTLPMPYYSVMTDDLNDCTIWLPAGYSYKNA